MPRYAQIDSNNIVSGVSDLRDAGMELTNPQLIPIADTEDPIGKQWDGVTFAEVPDTTPALNVTLDPPEESPGVHVATVGATVVASGEIRFPDGTLAPVNTTYRVPLIGVDGVQAKLLKVVFTGGQASVSFSVNKPGIYTVDLTKVVPAATSKLGISPTLIVDEI